MKKNEKNFDFKRYHQIKIENYNNEQDAFFIKKILIPYLSSVYFAMISKGNKDYLSITKTKSYLNLPELIGDRLVKQMNANGDERIDHDEFVVFLTNLFMGTLEQKILIAFKCYDSEGEEVITEDEIELVLKHIPLYFDSHLGTSFQNN